MLSKAFQERIAVSLLLNMSGRKKSGPKAGYIAGHALKKAFWPFGIILFVVAVGVVRWL